MAFPLLDFLSYTDSPNSRGEYEWLPGCMSGWGCEQDRNNGCFADTNPVQEPAGGFEINRSVGKIYHKYVKMSINE